MKNNRIPMIEVERIPMIEVEEDKIGTYKRTQTYKYLGKSLSIYGEDAKQVEDVIKCTRRR